mgnify:CR=1 FL=1
MFVVFLDLAFLTRDMPAGFVQIAFSSFAIAVKAPPSALGRTGV